MTFDINTWPKDPANGRFLCSPEHPMPHPNILPRGTRWAHTGRNLTSAGEYYDHFICTDCGHTWSEELAE